MATKGPSLEAIRRFKEQQEKKKREEDERKFKEKLSTLEHRAARGDRKAKLDLKKIEKVKKEKQRVPEPKPKQLPQESRKQTDVKKPKIITTNFAELMNLAKHNNNEVKKEEPNQNKVIIPKKPPARVSKPEPTAITTRPKSCSQLPKNHYPIKHPAPINRSLQPKMPVSSSRQTHLHHVKPMPNYTRPPAYHDDEEEEEDEYETDDFVVDEDDDDIQDEVSRTIRSVFRYDKRRCDRREEEIDRQYRAIGRVTTFEDLEREERRAARLAAAEDAEELRQEEERKRMKKARLKRYN